MNIHASFRTGIALLSILLLGLPLLASAGEGRRGHGPDHHDPETRLARMTEKLNLSDEQQDALRPILEDQAESFRALHERKLAGENRDALHAEIRAQRDSNTAGIETILDADQIAAYREMREAHRARMREHRQPRS